MNSADLRQQRMQNHRSSFRQKDPRYLRRVLRARGGPQGWIERHLHILTKDSGVQLLRFNAAQLSYYQSRTLRDLILKPRQVGFTTLICALFLADCLLRPNRVCVIVAHNAESGQRIFAMVKLMWARMPAAWHSRYPTKLDNQGEIWWSGLNSRISVGSAGSPGLGRGLTIHNLLCSEVAHWPHPQEALAALLEAVPADGRVIIESTPNGFGDCFHTLWTEAKSGQSGFRPFLFRWFDDPSYRMAGEELGDLSDEEISLRRAHHLDDAQLRWRRRKKQLLREKFDQEYPADDVSCFLTTGHCCFPVASLLEMARGAEQESPRQIQSMALYRWGMGRHYVGRIAVAPGRLTVYRMPEVGRSYVIGADAAEGLEHGDWSAAVVLDWHTGKQVAELHGKWRPDVFARVLAALAANYGWAYLAVENNGHGLPTLLTLRNEFHYPHLYYTVQGNRAVKLGWSTTSASKPLMVDQMAAALADGKLVLRSPVLVDECLSFVSKDGGQQEAEEGKHDDLVIACAIALQVVRTRRPLHEVKRAPEWG